MPPTINRVRMRYPRYTLGRTRPIRMLVLHATAGSAPGDFEWLRNGGSADSPVSCHYYVAKDGGITQFVEDADTAWHAGESRWVIDGKPVIGCNPWSIGIELSNRNDGVDPYPEAQYRAALDLTRNLIRRYAIPRLNLVRHLDISPSRKIDPAGFDWTQFCLDAYADDWAAWGTAYPLPIEQRLFAIPQMWLRVGDLGAAVSDEIPWQRGTARLFERGAVVWERERGLTRIYR